MELIKLKADLDAAMSRAESARRAERWQDLCNALDDAADLAETISNEVKKL